MNCGCDNAAVFCTVGTHDECELLELVTAVHRNDDHHTLICEISTVLCRVMHCAYPSLHTTGISSSLIMN